MKLRELVIRQLCVIALVVAVLLNYAADLLDDTVSVWQNFGAALLSIAAIAVSALFAVDYQLDKARREQIDWQNQRIATLQDRLLHAQSLLEEKLRRDQ